MALDTTGLTGSGLTTNFKVQYENSLSGKANMIANANALLAVIENEFNVTTGWFNTPGGKFGTGNRQEVDLNRGAGSGANNSGYGNPINLDSQNNNSNLSVASGEVEMVFMNEWVEVLMGIAGNWNAGDSNGEGLSQYCGIIRFQAGHYNYYNSWVEQWMNQNPRPDWVNTTFTGNSTVHGDGDPISFGCSLAFIFYLNVQLNFSINQIIAAYNSNLATAYHTLTGDQGDPFPFFASLLENVYPTGTNANIPGPVTDNPFPLGFLSFWANKNTFGLDEVKDVIKTSGGNWPKAFWLVVDGFSENSFKALGIKISPPTGSFAGLKGVTITQNPDIDFENATNPQAPQKIRVPFDIHFANSSLTDFPGTGSSTYDLASFLTVGGTKITGSDAAIEFELVSGADPYFTNINTKSGDPTANNDFYLSQDLRIFTVTPGKNPVPVAGAPAFGGDNVAGAFGYIKSLLTWLNNPSNHFTDGSQDPFTSGVIPQQDGALENDSSVSPFTVELANFPFGFEVFNNYNFAIARVRMQGTAGTPGEAKAVRVFFRLWSTQTADTDYQTGSTYPFTADAAGKPGSPLVGTNHHTLPFFASGNLSGNSDYSGGGANIRDIQIPTVPAGQDSIWAYYGCFLNLYDGGNLIDGQPVQKWLNGTHHCLVAQIAYDGAPIFGGATPSASDKLAQRNLQVTLSDNPGPASAHRIPQTFDIRPSGGFNTGTPDELMIDWGSIPEGSVASIFWPQVMASDVIKLAASMYSSHTLSAADVHTIQCKVTGGVTYIPIPVSGGENFAGLFTVDLPTTVKKGQEFNILVRRVSTRQIPPPVKINTPRRTHSLPSNAGMVVKPAKGKLVQVIDGNARGTGTFVPSPLQTYRYVVGAFSVKIPVTTGETMLIPEKNTLAIMKWRLLQMTPADRWYPVLERYISYIAARVDGLGGDSNSILPSVNGVPVESLYKAPHEHEYTGKVCEVLFDCFGDFEGFVLDTCSGSHSFKTRQRGIEDVVLRACRERLRLSVWVEEKFGDRIRELAIRC